ncbi:hypothetical protein AUR64_14310 [Haloprofundus marisrubri]|uniref:Uncharacterized protein n=1 Tax=Haloprofundus marisrubri TaxID=1514971 RepID=A0A0W1R6Z6_9EURY|nr:hypothetical protein AUR64_14310 [Haloprofundus marisrubri]
MVESGQYFFDVFAARRIVLSSRNRYSEVLKEDRSSLFCEIRKNSSATWVTDSTRNYVFERPVRERLSGLI